MLGNLSDAVWQDLKFGARQLRLNPGFTAVAVLSLALGIGANTAIFQLVDAIRLRTLPVEKPEELAYVDFVKGAARSGWFSTRSARFTSVLWEQVRDQQQAFSGLAAWSAGRFNLATGGEARNADALFVNGDFFRVLGIQPVLGRLFSAADDRRGCSPAAVISYAFWQSEFGGDPAILNRTLTLDGRTFAIQGVTPPEFFGVEVGNRFSVAIPMCADDLFPGNNGKTRSQIRTAWWISMMGRLKPGWTLERATAHLQTLSPGIMQAGLPETYRPEQAKKFLANKLEATAGGTGVSGLRRNYETPLWLLLATTGMVLLIACANLANLLLARASVREREIAVRQAIGASRARVIGQLLAESLLLSLAGALLGLALAQILSRGLIAFLTTGENNLFVGLGVDLRVLAFTAGIAIATCVLFGLVPALRATRVSPASAMRAGGRGMTAGREGFSLRRVLVVTQVALSLVLLVGALLFVRSLQKLITVDAGFRPEGLLSVQIDLRGGQFSKERLPEVTRQILEKLRAVPGVESAAQVGFTPVSGSGWNETLRPDSSTDAAKESHFNRAGIGYFKTMGTALAAGRDFDERDNLSSPKVAIVNEAFAKKIFNGENPVGHTFRKEGEAGKPDDVFQIVGLVRNTKYYELREEFIPIAFLPILQEEGHQGATFVLRVNGPLRGIRQGAEEAIAGVHSKIGIEYRVLTQQLKESLQRDQLMATLAGAFGLLAGLLATLGLYGVISYMVARRRNEIGVRIALGADRGRVVRMVLREAVLLLVAGMVIGLGLSLWAGQTAASLLYGLKPNDPVTLAAAGALLALVALLASYGPALRASRVEPMQALREE